MIPRECQTYGCGDPDCAHKRAARLPGEAMPRTVWDCLPGDGHGAPTVAAARRERERLAHLRRLLDLQREDERRIRAERERRTWR